MECIQQITKGLNTWIVFEKTRQTRKHSKQNDSLLL